MYKVKYDYLSNVFPNYVYFLDVAEAKNVYEIQMDLASYSLFDSDEKNDMFPYESFKNMKELTSYFKNVEDIEEKISSYLSNNEELNPKKISLVYSDNKVCFLPMEPWDYSNNEKNLTKEELIELLDRIAERLEG